MKRIWVNYNKWEDWKNGFYTNDGTRDKNKDKELVIQLFSNQGLFFETCIKVIKEWKNSSDYNLSYAKSNRVSYLGQACACYLYGIPMKVTAKNWSNVPSKNQKEANETAKKATEVYDLIYYKAPYGGLNEELS